MYYPIGWHKVLNVDIQNGPEPGNILSIQANHERELFFILTKRSLHIWYPRPAVEIACHRRSIESIDKIGFNKSAVWKTDSSVIVVATEGDQLLFFQLHRRTTSSSLLLSGFSDSGIYNIRHDKRDIENVLNRETIKSIPTNNSSVPALSIFSFGKLDLKFIGISCLMNAEEEIIVGAKNGNIYGVNWDGSVDGKFPWSLTKDIKKGSDHLVDLKFSSIIAGFALVFNSGRIGFMPLKSKSDKVDDECGDEETHRESAQESRVNFHAGTNDAVCVEVNHRYRLMAFGLKRSQVLVCNVCETNCSLVVNHKLELQVAKIPHDSTKLGSVTCLRYSPDSLALIVAWEGGDFAVWSVFGALLFCTQQWKLEYQLDKSIKPIVITSLAWGREGYSLWLSTANQSYSSEDDSFHLNGQSLPDDNQTISTMGTAYRFQQEEVLIMSIARSSLSSSPHLTCSSDSIILMSEERLYVGPSVPHEDKFDHWFVIDIPQTYLEDNYPIRYAIVDRECRSLAIAGNTGFATYTLGTCKWKFFAKKSQETGFSLCGDLIWWNDYLVMSCYNLEKESYEIRAYSTSETLDNDHMVIQPTTKEVMRLSIFENRLLVLYGNGTLGMFMLNLRRRPVFKKSKAKRSDSVASENSYIDDEGCPDSPRSIRSDSTISFNHPLKKQHPLFKDVFLQISPIENLVISNLQANAYCISSIALTRLHFKNSRHDDSILLNACGKLFLLEREVPPDLVTPSPTSDLSTAELNDLSLGSHKSNDLETNKVSSAKRLSNLKHFASASLKNSIEPSALLNVTFKAVSVIATNVEQFWISPEISNASEMSFFKKSLWLSCGGTNNYLQVWLPLLNDKKDPPTDLYVPDRIMLPIKCDIYPLAIRSSAPDVIEPDDAIVLGAESDILYRDCKLFTRFPYSTVKRQCRVYLHRVLRELLLNQHLGYYARKIAESCQSLPYFAHCFELLLHEVLEEEATSPVPLPDPMLPQVVRFIKEFPVYLETVVHCARKSELSMWSHLFDERAVGNPRRLFQECLEKHKLDTAASCLIILHSLDRNIVSQKMVKELIRAAKDDSQFNYLIQDLENFLVRAELDYLSLSSSGSPV